MAFQFSHEFHRNWLAAPVGTRQQIKAELSSIVELLKPETALSAWQKKHGFNRKSTASAEQVSLFAEDADDADDADDAQNLAGKAGSGEEMSDFIRQVRGVDSSTPTGTQANQSQHSFVNPNSEVVDKAQTAAQITLNKAELKDRIRQTLEQTWRELKPKLEQDLFEQLTK